MAGERWLVRVARGGCVVFAWAVAGLHAAQPELSAARDAVSFYVHGRLGVLLTLGLAALGVAALALSALLAPAGRAARWSVGTWGACLLAGAVFAADPPGRWHEPPSFAGLVHAAAAMAGFLALPVGALALARRKPRTTASALSTVASLGLFAASLWPTIGAERPPVLLGLAERVLLAAYIGWMWTAAGAGCRAVDGGVPPA
jgi:hypothetical protein